MRTTIENGLLELKSDSKNINDNDDRSWFAIFRAAVDAAYDAVLITDAELDSPGPRIIHANPAFCRMTGYRLDEILGKSPRILQGPETDAAVMRRLRDDLEHGRHFEGSTKNYRKDGTAFEMEWTIAPVRDDDGRITHYVALQRDVTERKRLLEMLRHQALIDGLTGALNRDETQRLLALEVERARRYGTKLSVVIFDIDHFKAINDRYGHNLGDEVLAGIAETVRPRMRTTDHFGRWGGEEFVAVLPQTRCKGAKAFAEDIRARVEALTFRDGVRVTASFGVAARIDETNETALIERADRALYHAKDSGRNQVSVASGNEPE